MPPNLLLTSRMLNLCTELDSALITCTPSPSCPLNVLQLLWPWLHCFISHEQHCDCAYRWDSSWTFLTSHECLHLKGKTRQWHMLAILVALWALVVLVLLLVLKVFYGCKGRRLGGKLEAQIFTEEASLDHFPSQHFCFFLIAVFKLDLDFSKRV